MKHNNNTHSLRTFLLSLLLILVVIGGVYAAGVYQIYHFNSGMEIPDNDTNLLARFKVDDEGFFTSPSGKKVVLDMGSRHCFISRQTLEEFRASGYPIEEYPTLIYTTDHSGHYRIYTRKVVMDMLLPSPVYPDSALRIKNVELLISREPEDNILGMDCLDRFVIEHNANNGEISLYRSVPEGYTEVCSIDSHDSYLGDIIGYSRRVFIPLLVNDAGAHNYYFDTGTGMRQHDLVQPEGNIDRATTRVVLDTISGRMTQENCRVQVGNRLMFARVTYADDLHTDKYSVNPFRLFNQSIAMDLPNKKLFYHIPTKTDNRLADSR